jgi:hypothetical protein
MPEWSGFFIKSVLRIHLLPPCKKTIGLHPAIFPIMTTYRTILLVTGKQKIPQPQRLQGGKASSAPRPEFFPACFLQPAPREPPTLNFTREA